MHCPAIAMDTGKQTLGVDCGSMSHDLYETVLI